MGKLHHNLSEKEIDKGSLQPVEEVASACNFARITSRTVYQEICDALFHLRRGYESVLGNKRRLNMHPVFV